jgi:hypothetical protein
MGILTRFLSTLELLGRVGQVAVGAGLAVVVLLAVGVRRYAFRGATIWAALFAVLALVSSGTLASLAILNETLDTSRPVEHTELITRKWRTSGRHTSYYIAMPSWRSDHSREDFSLSFSTWNRVQVDMSHYVVQSRAGRFGVEWIQEQRLIR